jgi:hypothetical protein
MIVMAASSRLPSIFSIRVLLSWINCVVLMVTESPGYETGLRAYCIIKKILGYWALGYLIITVPSITPQLDFSRK